MVAAIDAKEEKATPHRRPGCWLEALIKFPPDHALTGRSHTKANTDGDP